MPQTLERPPAFQILEDLREYPSVLPLVSAAQVERLARFARAHRFPVDVMQAHIRVHIPSTDTRTKERGELIVLADTMAGLKMGLGY
jgi:ribosome-associated toxin RatA of RatAB toxin-antitoxin module